MLLFNVLVVIFFILGFYICGQAGKRTNKANKECNEAIARCTDYLGEIGKLIGEIGKLNYQDLKNKLDIVNLEELAHANNVTIGTLHHELIRAEARCNELQNEVDSLNKEIVVIYRFTE